MPPSGEIARTDPIALTYSLPLDTPDLALDDPHTVTVVVADRSMITNQAIGFPDTADGRDGQFDLYQWSFVFTAEGLCSELR